MPLRTFVSLLAVVAVIAKPFDPTPSPSGLCRANAITPSTAAEPTLIMCTAADCASGSCQTSYKLRDVATGGCLPIVATSRRFLSAYIDSPGGATIPFSVWVNRDRAPCPQFLTRIPNINQCTALAGGANAYVLRSGSTP
ncbi:hypothetical protein Hypma_003912 [Hypsizygus marmoreus]|uniref:Uncharacterized protein n=1 Tax=Hypsizygus marmoreus TaxID=39966 RepID=A0A369JYR8_HYPMA|nr:hypothetical protein Hypma_003912 [Hypsizygus marmoreus]